MSILEILRMVLASSVGSFFGTFIATIILTKHAEKKKKRKNFAKINGNSNTVTQSYEEKNMESEYRYMIAYIAPNERVVKEEMFATSIKDAIEKFKTKYPSCQYKVIAVTNLDGY